jgi:hypothetical protein
MVHQGQGSGEIHAVKWAKACGVTVIPILSFPRVDLRSCMHKVMRLCRPFGHPSAKNTSPWQLPRLCSTRIRRGNDCPMRREDASRIIRALVPKGALYNRHSVWGVFDMHECDRGISEEHGSSQHINVSEQIILFVDEAVRAARGRGADGGNSNDKVKTTHLSVKARLRREDAFLDITYNGIYNERKVMDEAQNSFPDSHPPCPAARQTCGRKRLA